MELNNNASSLPTTSSNLTEAQRERIRKNRENALKIRLQKEEERRLREQKAQQQAQHSPYQRPPNNAWMSKASAAVRTGPITFGAGRLPAISHSPSSSSTSNKPSIDVDFLLVDDTRFKVQFNPFQMEIVDQLKTISSSFYNADTKTWSFLIRDYDATIRALDKLKLRFDLKINEIPFNVRNLFFNKICVSQKVNLHKIGDLLCNRLFPFQRDGVRFGVERNGRLLVADEMGLGKSVQALAIANYYRTEWPLLVVCPSSVKYAWQSQLRNFVPDSDVFVIEKQSDYLPGSRQTSIATIISYDLMVAKAPELKRNSIYVIIFDESHMLKEQTTKRAKVAFDLSKIAHRVILLSGTPALSRPSELFSQIRMIDPKIFPNWRSYGVRYCEGRRGRFGFEAKGRSNPDELKTVMNKIMIRRLKKDVLDDLPEKNREIVFLSGDSIQAKIRELQKARAECEKANKYSDKKTKRETFLEYYVQTGLAKMKAVSDHIVDSFFNNEDVSKKVLVFAHHTAVLDAIGLALAKAGVQFIRIDGSTPARDRAVYCDQFQSDPRTMAAVLSITAAGTGITLTAASIVVFAELYWNPSSMIQAEDRAHRVGQRDSVRVQYLVARRTADMDLWQLVGSKLKVLGEVNLSNETYRDAENTEKLCSSSSSYLITDFYEVMKDDLTDCGKAYEPIKSDSEAIEPEFKRVKLFGIANSLEEKEDDESRFP